jgi:LPXTG-motif cell wall-anchored protein
MRAAHYMARENIMRPHAAGLLLTALVWVLGGNAVVHAQDTIPDTPPELRDFRLDEPRPQTQPAPTTQPTQQPAAPSTVPSVPESAPEQATQTIRSTEPALRPEAQRVAPSSQVITGSEPSQAPAIEQDGAPESMSEAAEPAVDESASPAVVAEPVQSPWDGGLIFGIAGGVLFLGLLALLFRRRRRHSRAADDSDVASTSVAEAALPQATPAQNPQPPSAAAAAKIPIGSEPETGDISIIFIPEKATISFTNLTVHGQLQIANEGKALAKDMQLRAVLLSASSQQQLAIDTFFADPAQIPPNPLGEAKPGERLGLSLELTVPLYEMQTFPLGDQRLLVPIVVASLSYSGGGSDATSEARLACMIGREAQPPKPKMGPLRLDKGPRSFAPLGQRSIAA